MPHYHGVTDQDIIDALRLACQNAGGQKAWAAAHGLSPQYVGDVLLQRRPPSATVGAALGFVLMREWREADA